MDLLLDELWGIYIPQRFAEIFDMRAWNVSEESEAVLLAGPDEDNYWEVWEEVLDKAIILNDSGETLALYQDGCLFACQYDSRY